jgi:uncharacterized protein YciI
MNGAVPAQMIRNGAASPTRAGRDTNPRSRTMTKLAVCLLSGLLLGRAVAALAQTSPDTLAPPYDPALAKSLGADERGMRSYVLVILKTGPTKVPAGPERDEMFKGHFANIERLAAEGKLITAGPLDGVDGRRGIFILDVAGVDEAKKIAATDPVLVKGEMEAEFHKFYGSAALMLVRETHGKIVKKR